MSLSQWSITSRVIRWCLQAWA